MNTSRLESRRDEAPSRKTDCWQSIANDPERLRYWREIARLWRGSLSIDTHHPARGPLFD